MKHFIPFVAFAVLGATGAVAQSTTQAANARESAQVTAPTAADRMNVQNQAQYQRDLATYEQSLRSSHHEAVRDQVRYNRQRRAYADAMTVWREQVRACHRGNTRACKAPTPNPADYY